MTSYDIIYVKKEQVWPKVYGVLVLQNFGWCLGNHVGFLILCFSYKVHTFFFIFLQSAHSLLPLSCIELDLSVLLT
jgi:hypothetical protein